MKKILSLLIITLILFPMMLSVVSASSDYESELLSALSIMQGDPDGNMRYTEKVSRAECAKIVVATSTYRNAVEKENKISPFKDVTYTHWASPYISVGVKYGLFKGYLDATFRPSNTVLFEEAAMMFLGVLGYTNEDFGNDWPYDHVNFAKNIGLFDSINKRTGQELTRRDISSMAYNTLMSKEKGAQTNYLSAFNRTTGPKTVLSSDWYKEFDADATITVVRDGIKSSISEVKVNDILYYMEEYNTVLVYSKKVTGIYEAALPNKDAPTSVTVSGVTYSLEGVNAFSKLSSSGTFNYGDTVTLLLGKSGDVADVMAQSETNDVLYGFLIASGTKQTTVSGSSVIKPYVKIILPSGEAYEYITNKDYSKGLNKIVSVTFKDGIATLSLNTSNDNISGKFIWTSTTRQFGSATLADDVKILEVSTTQPNETALTSSVFPQRLNGMSISKNSVLYSSKNSDGYIDKLILADTTNDMHTYGIITKADNNINSQSVFGSYEYISNGNVSSIRTSNTAFSVSSGEAVMIKSDGKSVISISSLNKLSANNISSITDSFITVDKKTYTLSDKVQFYIKNSYDYSMITKDEFIDIKDEYTASVYIDKTNNTGARVRIIVIS